MSSVLFLPKKPPAPDHIGDLSESPTRSDWIDSKSSNYEKMEKSTTFSAPFICSSLPPDTKVLCPRMSFRLNTTEIDNQYKLYSRTCAYG